MYAVVGCTDCGALWLLSDPETAETAQCPRCGKRHRTERLRRFYESADREAARQARATMLAERGGQGEAFEGVESVADMERQLDDAGVDDREFLAAAGLDPDEVEAAGEATPASGGSRDHREVVLDAVRGGDRPTGDEIVDYATDRGVPAEAARALLEKLTRRGEVSESRGRYRPL